MGRDADVLSGRIGRFRREGLLGLGLEDAASAARCRDGAARADGGLRAYRRVLRTARLHGLIPCRKLPLGPRSSPATWQVRAR